MALKARALTRDEVDALLEIGRETHYDKKPLPPHIQEKKREIEAAKRNAFLFIVNTGGAIDYGMLDAIVQMMFELDSFYAGMIEDRAAAKRKLN